MDWTREELSGAVAAYVEMLDLERRGSKFEKKRYYETLSTQFNRSAKAFECRMQNISYVYSVLGRQWLKGLKPAQHVGVNVSRIIEELISEHGGTFSSPKVAFHEQIAALRRSPDRFEAAASDVARISCDIWLYLISPNLLTNSYLKRRGCTASVISSVPTMFSS